jgi:hypothetical protein
MLGQILEHLKWQGKEAGMAGIKCIYCGGLDGAHEESCAPRADYHRRAAAEQKIDAGKETGGGPCSHCNGDPYGAFIDETPCCRCRGSGHEPLPPGPDQRDQTGPPPTAPIDAAAELKERGLPVGVDAAAGQELMTMNHLWEDLRHHGRAARWRILEWLRAKSETTP